MNNTPPLYPSHSFDSACEAFKREGFVRFTSEDAAYSFEKAIYLFCYLFASGAAYSVRQGSFTDAGFISIININASRVVGINVARYDGSGGNWFATITIKDGPTVSIGDGSKLGAIEIAINVKKAAGCEVVITGV